MIGLDFDEIYDSSFKEEYYEAFSKTGKFRGFNFGFEENKKKKTLKEKLEDLITKTDCIEEKRILDYLLKNLKTLLIGNINDLRNIHFEISCKWTIDLSESLLPKLEKIFDYDKLYNRKHNKVTFGRYLLDFIIEKVGIRVCPYCNEDYVKLIKVENEGIVYRSPFEHFFPKSKYPYFALSLANLIPSCVTCNSLKGEKEPNGLKNIYEISDDFVFSWIPIDSDGIDKIVMIRNFTESISNDNLEKTINDLSDKVYFFFKRYIESNLKIFRIEERYALHKEIFTELLLKMSIENKEKQEFLKNAFPDLNIREKDIYRFFFCNYLPDNEKDLLKRPLSKATYDIYKELKQYMEEDR